MLFNKNDGKTIDKIIYKTKPNMLLGCKKAIFGIVLLIIVLTIAPMVIRFIGEMQVYLISQIQLSLTRYAAIAFFVIILITVIYIIWQLIGWYSMEYVLTETKIIVKSGVLSTKKNYMPYATIQDMNTSQGILARLFNVGSVSVFSAYDNNQLELKNISNPSEVEEIIFSKMTGSRNFQVPPQHMPQYGERGYSNNVDYYPREDNLFNDNSDNYSRDDGRFNDNEIFSSTDDYLGRNDYYDEYEPITPITHERNSYQRREYEYYPEEFENINHSPRHTYKYEPYDTGYNRPPSNMQRENNYNEPRQEYSYNDDVYHQDNDAQNYYNESAENHSHNNSDDIDDGSEKVIKRHFDKFKK